MASILMQALSTRETGFLKPVRCKLEPINITATQACALELGERVEFEMSATISVKFSSTKREYEYAKQNAIRMINHAMYEDALTLTARMKSAVYGDEQEELLSLIAELERAIGL
jgi:hypothetical protein